MADSRFHGNSPWKLTMEWGDRQAQALWNNWLGLWPIEWQGKTVLDFGCAWGYLPKYLAEHQGVAVAYGVDLHPQWTQMSEWSPKQVDKLKLYAGNITEIEDLKDVRFDVIVSSGTLMLIRPTELHGILAWFYSHLSAGGTCLLRTRTFFSPIGGDLHTALASPLPHLLFPRRTIDRYLRERNKGATRYMNPMCAASYLMLYRRVGFEILDVRRHMTHLEETTYEEFGDKLSIFDPQELRTAELTVLLRKPDQISSSME